jgi:hypothetical protein
MLTSHQFIILLQHTSLPEDQKSHFVELFKTQGGFLPEQLTELTNSMSASQNRYRAEQNKYATAGQALANRYTSEYLASKEALEKKHFTLAQNEVSWYKDKLTPLAVKLEAESEKDTENELKQLIQDNSDTIAELSEIIQELTADYLEEKTALETEFFDQLTLIDDVIENLITGRPLEKESDLAADYNITITTRTEGIADESECIRIIEDIDRKHLSRIQKTKTEVENIRAFLTSYHEKFSPIPSGTAT